ncbi:hypothetical protein WME85_06135 [Sorangium sp. So ce1153]
MRDAREDVLDFFVATTDTFEGNSGSGVYETVDYTVAGILVDGEKDYVKKGSCRVVNTCPKDGCGGESITYVYPAIEEFCASHESAPLCSE